MADLKNVLITAWKQASARQASLMAAGVAFYTFLAIFPAIISAVLLYGLVVSEETLQRHIAEITDAMPADAASLITGQMESLAATSGGSLGLGLAIALVVALYSASGGVSALITGVNAMFGYRETRNIVRLKLLALGVTVGAILFFAVVVSLVAVAPAVLDEAIDGYGPRALLELLRWPVLLGALVVAIGMLYRIAPNRDRDDDEPRLVNRGVLVSAGLWLAVSLVFSLYVDNFGSYGKTYGALAGVVVLLLWLWAGLFALFLGASVEALREEAPTDDLPEDVAERVAEVTSDA